MPTIDATVSGANSNSYESVAEADLYFDARLPLVPPWSPGAAVNIVALIMGTRLLDALAQPFRTFIPANGGTAAYYRARRQWTGSPATTTQRLAWPRIGMFDRNGNAIPSNVIPQDLKEALAEFAGQLKKADRTLDNDVITQGLKSLTADSVSLSFKDSILPQVIPDAVFNLMPQSWLTEEIITYATTAEFNLIS